MLLGPADDLCIQARDALHEEQVVLIEGVFSGAVVQVQDTQHSPVGHQRYRQRRLHVEPFADDLEPASVGFTAQQKGAGTGGYVAGDAKVTYSWQPVPTCNETGSGSFTQAIA